MMASNCRVGIVGAGTTGVYLARLLLQQGFQVDLFEKAPQPRTEGCGILLVQAGMKALNEGDPEVCQAIIRAGVPVTRFEFRNLKGELINAEDVTYAEAELPGILIHRRLILEALLAGFPSERLHTNASLQSLTQSDRQVVAHFKDGSQWEGDVLIGADGIVSKVRQSVVPDVPLCYLGDLVWRGVVADESFCPDGTFIVYARGRGIYANFFDMGNGRTHWGFFVEQEQPDGEVGALVPQDQSIPPEALEKLPDDARAVIESTPLEQVITRYSYDIDPLPRLHDNRVVLLGDAGHAKSSTRARGMTAGFEDAVALMRHMIHHDDVKAALAAFETERLPIVHEYQRTSREMSQTIGRQRKQAA
ncbi:FAD-dependent monooxygenase [Oscillatoria sp. FACHB-1407]|uniref:FAD-dependent monooxygenase n=1 Tax=Oscillatoria sp. FACHB-1407 TaxID=2692847 RepID=UPI001685B959|nr:FAD-dependent monooxygenase [Oscillatoria sp. FACHB-1407]MBD2464912.1 FAD-dependent monooxygenase [Oscillatoria sp. FACHB-1407]